MKKFLTALICLANPAAADCGNPDTACQVDLGSYHIVLPEGDGPHPVLMFLHGYGAKGGPLVKGGTAKNAQANGFAYIAPNALPRDGAPSIWHFGPLDTGARDEQAFFQQVLLDAKTRFNIDPARAVLSGFSLGGSMTSYTACEYPDSFTAYAPVSGSLWRPHPESCAGPIKLLHTHGWRDTTVPLEGRILRRDDAGNATLTQGDAFHSMELFRAANDCTENHAKQFPDTEGYWRKAWTNCADGSALEFALFNGGHGVPKGWSNMVFNWLERVMP